MSNRFKETNRKHHIYYFFDDMINIKYFDLNKVTIDQK